MKVLIFLLLLGIIPVITCENKYTKNQTSCVTDDEGNQQCSKKDAEGEENDDEPVFYEEDSEDVASTKKDEIGLKIEEKVPEKSERLRQWDPVKVGYEREIEVAPGEKVIMRTAALRPKAFIIDNFLTEAECDHIIGKALNNGLFDSGLHIDPATRKNKKYTYGAASSAVGDFKQWDRNGNGEITITEIMRMAQKNVKLYMNETDIKEMFEILKMQEAEDGVITKEEFRTMNTAGVAEYMKTLREEHPRFRDRFSEQRWLRQDDTSDRIMQRLRNKVVKLTNLPRYIVEGGEALQVLRYQKFGHYHAHFDGQDSDAHPEKKICCHMAEEPDPNTCKLCRFITILYYLNDVEEGGETAFPVADQPNYRHEEFQKREKDDLYNLSNFCHNSSLVVKPKRGRAIMWYNHDMDKNGWLGKMDYYGLHGGCDIIKGIKWIANNWLTAPPSELSHIKSQYLDMSNSGAA